MSTIAVLSVVATLVCPLLGATSASAATTTPPDMKILVPTKLISIGSDPTNGHRQLRYTHITEDAGTGPFEIDPTYNSATGISTFVQSLYNSPSPGVWTFDHAIPLGINGAFVPRSDYRFPLTRFTLNGVNPDGSIGPVVAVSPKTDYCITGDNRVGDVPNTPAQTSPPADNCSDPTRSLGWSVGWGDQYDQTDSGQPIDINGVADGSYLLRAIVDPQHVLTESDATNNVTDTMLTITGTSVTVGAQTHPVVTAPSIAITGPVEGASVSGTVDLTVNTAATSPATVVGVQYLLDGNPLGSRQTTAPFSFSWTVGSTTAGSHRITAQATDSTGSIGTAPVVTVTVPPAGLPGGFAVDQTVNRTGHGAVTTSAFSTAAPSETLMAYVAADGPNAGGAQSATVSGAGLSWGLVKRSNGQPGDAEIWTATAAGTLAGATVTSTLASAGFDQQLTVVTYAGAAGVGSSAVRSAATGAPSVGLTASTAGSLVYGVGNDYDTATARTIGAGQSVVNQWLDTSSGDTFWAQRTVAGSTAAGQAIAIDDPAPTGDHWNLAAAEIKPGGNTPPDTTPPTVSITNPVAGQIVSGTRPVAAAASDNVAVAAVQFLLDGQPLGGS
ncbi:MAG TPA: Ig-like domain-containing protein, partial [Nakamurella sp.]